MTQEDLGKKFAALVAEPIIVWVRDLDSQFLAINPYLKKNGGDDDSVASDGDDGSSEDKSTNLSFNCDACQAEEIDPLIRSHADPDHELCCACYNRLRKATVAPATVAAGEEAWQARLEKTWEDGYQESVDRYNRNVAIWNMVNKSPCPFSAPRPFPSNKRRRTAADDEKVESDADDQKESVSVEKSENPKL